MSELITVARPYAKAAFEFAKEQQNVDAWQQMLTFAAEVSRDSQIRDLLSGDMKSEQLAEIFISVCGEQLDEHGQNLIKIMAMNKRLFTLPEVLEQFVYFRAEDESTLDVDVVSAYTLNSKQLANIKAGMEKRLSRTVKLKCIIDKSVVAGIIIRAGDMVIDGSIRSRFERLADTLQS